ncbi:MAG: phosphodiester glycosidase family protein [Calditrichaeota bacterium]|nr:phosphodiester glycosidase family protein [Calditrichota bacterium]HQU70672.1 phosphodiester glycosidase family protein [Calditrichia bacterium]
MLRPLFAGISFCLLLLFSRCSPDVEPPTLPMNWQAVDSINQHLPAGIRLYQGRNDSLPINAWYVYIEEPDPDIRTRVVMSRDSTDNRESISDFARNLGACVVINGGYFTMNLVPARHAGLLKMEDRVHYPATRRVTRKDTAYATARGTLGFLEGDRPDISWAISRGDSLFRLEPPYDHRPGKPDLSRDSTHWVSWPVREAISAGPVLVSEGKLNITDNGEVFFGSSIPNTHPRSAVGITPSGALLLMVVDGRQADSRGVDLRELATLMLEIGAFEALNLDGGGSSALVVNQTLINRPVGGTFQREVMSALAVFCRPAPNP